MAPFERPLLEEELATGVADDISPVVISADAALEIGAVELDKIGDRNGDGERVGDGDDSAGPPYASDKNVEAGTAVEAAYKSVLVYMSGSEKEAASEYEAGMNGLPARA